MSDEYMAPGLDGIDPAALDETAALIRSLGDEARERQREGVFELKADRTYVTALDYSLETRIKAFLKERFPGHRVLGEEKGFSGDGDSRWTWVLDPIDGTSNFALGLPYWAVCLALLDGLTPCWGCVYIPAQRELFLGARGKGATLNGRPIHVSDHGDMRPEDLFGVDTRSLTRFDYSFPQDARAVGAASLSIVFTACGRYVGFFLAHWHVWDIAAAMLIAREAGAVTTRLSGEPLNAFDAIDARVGPPILVAGPRLQKSLRAAIRPKPGQDTP